jgi:hypothetical protein
VAQLQTAALATEADPIKLHSALRARLHQVLGGSFDVTPATAVLMSEPMQ